jgi:catechol 2,3-dioxygenase-like lactoylglutathione lyase family enzyme
MRVIRVTAELGVTDIEEAMAFYTEFLGLDVQDMGLDWVARVVVPASSEHIQLLSQDAETPRLSIKVDDVEEAYAAAQPLGYGSFTR